MSIKTQPATELLERFDAAREKLGKNSFEARVLRMMAHRTTGAFEFVNAFKKIFDESSVNDPDRVVRHVGHYLQGAQYIEIMAPIIDLVQDEHTDANLNMLKAQIERVKDHAAQAVGDKFFNPMSTTNPFTNLANVEKHKAWIEVYNMFKFVDSENQ
jgi:hypothetical protein